MREDARAPAGSASAIPHQFPPLADYLWPIAAGCIRRASCSIRDG